MAHRRGPVRRRISAPADLAVARRLHDAGQRIGHHHAGTTCPVCGQRAASTFTERYEDSTATTYLPCGDTVA